MEDATHEPGSETDSDTGRLTRPLWLRPWLLPSVLFVAGLVVSWILFGLVEDREERRVRAGFGRTAANRVEELRRAVDECGHMLESLAAFYGASREVERDEFRRFVQPLMARGPAIQALEWVPRVSKSRNSDLLSRSRTAGSGNFVIRERDANDRMVPARERDEYFPVLFVEPAEGNEIAVGFDLASDPTRLLALRMARDEGGLAATVRIRLVQEPADQFGFLLLLPVYEGTPAETVESRREALSGFVVGVFRVGDLLESSLAGPGHEGIEFVAEDLSAPSGERFLGRFPADPRSEADDIRDRLPPEARYEPVLEVGGREWRVRCRPTATYVATHEPASALWVLAGGVLCAALLSGCVLLILVRIDRTRHHALEILRAKEGVEREMAERRLAEKQVQLLTTAIEQSTDGLAVVDLDGRLLFLNPAFAEMHGRSVEGLVGENLSIFHTVEQMPDVEAANRKLLETGRFVGEVGHARADGTTFPGLMHGSLVRDEAGEPIALVGTLRDVTHQRKMEKEMQKAEKLESLGLLAGGIAHDFNNLLTAMLGNISLARGQSEEGSSEHRWLGEAERASGRAQELTQQLLTFSRGGAPIKATVSIDQLVRETAGFTLRGSNVRCEFDIPPDLHPAEVDEGQISRVIGNLVLNADQSMPDGGILSVQCRNVELPDPDATPLAPGRYVRVSLEDRGTGIPPDHLPRIFDPYFTTKQEGSGLGLASAYSIARRHGGLITVDSELGRGTVFDLFLPASTRDAAPSSEPSALLQVRGARVLVMDDEKMVRTVARAMLEQLGCDVRSARDGREAIRLYEDAREDGGAFHLVIMDLTVPGGMGGLEALERLREIDPGVQCLVSSGYSNDPILAHYADYGFLGAVVKPYTLDELSAKLADVLRDLPDE